MVSKSFLIKNKSGLHVRPAGVLVKEIQPFESSVTLKFKDKEYNAKSVLGIMSACIKSGDEVTFEVDGPDENDALAAIEKAVESGLGE